MKTQLKIALAFVTTLCLVGCSNKVELKLKQETYDLEYGNKFNSQVSTYLENKEEIIEKTVLSISGNEDAYEENKEYPKVGEYDISFVYDNDDKTKVNAKIVVKDTTAPTFKDIKEKYEVEYGKELSTETFKAEDLSKVTITIEDKEVNYKKAGTYKATVTAKDEYENETKKEIEVVVKEEKKETTSTTSSKKTTSSSKKNTASSSSSTKKNTSSSSSASTSNKNNTSSNKNTGACNHGGYKPLVGGWYNNDTELQNFFGDYYMTHDCGNTYSAYECPDCGKWCIDYIE